MKRRSLQWRFPAARACAALATVALVGLAPAALRAQGGAPTPGPDPLCRCFVGDDSSAARGRDRDWALLGAAGLALLAGLPIGSAGTPAIPFVEGPPGPSAGLPAEVAALPPGVPAAGTPPLPGAPSGTGPTVAPVPAGPLAALPVPQLGFVPPKTATHLPLLAAAGVLLMGGGGLLARRQARRQRRRRRRIVAV